MTKEEVASRYVFLGTIVYIHVCNYHFHNCVPHTTLLQTQYFNSHIGEELCMHFLTPDLHICAYTIAYISSY